jgi:hypothetical protein
MDYESILKRGFRIEKNPGVKRIIDDLASKFDSFTAMQIFKELMTDRETDLRENSALFSQPKLVGKTPEYKQSFRDLTPHRIIRYFKISDEYQKVGKSHSGAILWERV